MVKARAFPSGNGVGAPKVCLVLDGDSHAATLVAKHHARAYTNDDTVRKVRIASEVEFADGSDLQQLSSSSSSLTLYSTTQQSGLETIKNDWKYA